MSWSTLSTVFNVLNGGWTFFKNLFSSIFGSKSDAKTDTSGIAAGEAAATKAVETANDVSKVAGATARESAGKLNKELSDAHDQEDSDLAALRAAGGVQRHDVIQNAIDRHNRRHASTDPSADDQANRPV